MPDQYFGGDIEQIAIALAQMPDGEEKDELIRQLYQDYEGQEAIIDDAIASAEEALATAPPEGRQAGDIYVAANPMEHMATALRNIGGAYEKRKANERREGLSADKTAAMGFSAREMMKPQPLADPMNQPNVGPQPLSQALRSEAPSPAATSTTPATAPLPLDTQPAMDTMQVHPITAKDRSQPQGMPSLGIVNKALNTPPPATQKMGEPVSTMSHGPSSGPRATQTMGRPNIQNMRQPWQQEMGQSGAPVSPKGFGDVDPNLLSEEEKQFLMALAMKRG